ncbi:hypothetical protein [Streptomyces sp. V1I1]|uniref:ARPP-2 domain-containing protein n=1 Tax=Streptomyces sp. V1I1 TaxID=3042272 RepID=UPI002781BF9C|nr:hypothetical protein [Streptomyces sp. V1I1]MDQ0943995.1 hypothetical protein [Streptomyces sp. V1I1]
MGADSARHPDPDALEHSPERLVIVSDGWDNAPPGPAGEVLRVWRTRLDPDRSTSVVHVNPVYDADGFDVRRLAPSVPTAGIRDAEDLAALVEIAQFAEGRTGEALRIFEIHPGQCGVLVYAADSLAAAFVVPHPADYRALHPSLIEDLYGELVHQYAFYGGPVPDFEARIRDGGHLKTLADLRAAARAQERAWAGNHDTLPAARLLDASYSFERVYAMGSFSLWRFLPPFRRGESEQHIGEAITDHKGRVAYLKTFRLSEAQIRRGHLLNRLHDHDWHLGRTAEALGTSYADLVRRIRSAGFESLLKQGVERMARD